jgi:2-polyprenyl-3-methyl-5-hydroxy-6-metoxy-1,4-benzoquinol methylase
VGFERRLISERYEDDRVPIVVLNDVQEEEIAEYNRRVLNGTYKRSVVLKCVICGSGDGYILAEKDRYGISMDTVVCSDCGLIFTKDRLDEKSFKKFYTEQYRDMYEGKRFSWSERELQTYFQSNGIGSRFVDNILRVSRLKPAALILEIGAGGGWNLIPFKERGFRVIGYDYDERFLDFGRSNGLDLRQGGAKEAAKNQEKADLVLLIDVIEHFDTPLVELEMIRAILKEDGQVFVKTPGLRAALYGRAGGDLLGYLQNAHTYLFERKTLEMVMEKAGFSAVACGEQVFGLFRKQKVRTETSSQPLKRGLLVWKTCRRIEKRRSWWSGLSDYLQSKGRGRYYDILVHWLSYFFNLNYLVAVFISPLLPRPTGEFGKGQR